MYRQAYITQNTFTDIVLLPFRPRRALIVCRMIRAILFWAAVAIAIPSSKSKFTDRLSTDAYGSIVMHEIVLFVGIRTLIWYGAERVGIVCVLHAPFSNLYSVQASWSLSYDTLIFCAVFPLYSHNRWRGNINMLSWEYLYEYVMHKHKRPFLKSAWMQYNWSPGCSGNSAI